MKTSVSYCDRKLEPVRSTEAGVYSDGMSESGDQYAIPGELLHEARDAERLLREKSQRVEGRYLTLRTFPVLQFNEKGSRGQISNRDLMEFLSPPARQRAFDSAAPAHVPVSDVPFKSRAGRVIVHFIELFFEEIRRKICKSNKTNFSVGAHMAAALTALAHWLADRFGIASELAKVSASAVLIAIATASKGAFCRLTAEGALEAILTAAR
jgi:hypothetical protein